MVCPLFNGSDSRNRRGVGLSCRMHTSYSALDFLITHFDPHGDEHADNVQVLAVQLSMAAGLDAQNAQWVETAAHYHDIGKIFIPEGIRRFPGMFTPIETLAMQKHCELGSQLLQCFPVDPQIIPIVFHHHENYDGSGYPMMLCGESIPIGAPVIRIVDSFDALTHSRGYRFACSHKRALEKMQEKREHYDPNMLDLFSELIRESWTRQPSR